MSGSGASPLSNYRARRRWEINDLLRDLASLDPSAQARLRSSILPLLAEVESSRLGDRLLAAKIRDARSQLETLAKSSQSPQP